MRILSSKRFLKAFQKLEKRHQSGVLDAVECFIANPLDPTLRNHALKGRREWMRSIDAWFDLRIIFRKKDDSYEIVELLDVGTHSELYG